MQEINPESPAEQVHGASEHRRTDQAALSREIASMHRMLEAQDKTLRSIRRSMHVSTVLSLLRFLIFLVPLILALIFLPPFIEEMLGTLQAFQGEADNQYGLTLPKGLDLQQLEQLFRQSTTPER